MATKAQLEAKRERLESLARFNGGVITPDAVVADAEDPDSPLHEDFEWDDSTAAAQHRLYQARHLIRSIKVEIKCSTRVIQHPAYVSVSNTEQGYHSTAKIRNKKALTRDALAIALTRAHSAIRGATDLAEVFNLTGELAELLSTIEHLRGQLDDVA